MKTSRILACLLAFGISSIRLEATLADVVTYTASSAGPGANPDAVGGANVWIVSLTSGDGSQNGSFAGNSAANGGGSGAGAGNPAWALYANSSQTAAATATFTSVGSSVLSNATEYVSLDFDNGFIDSGRSVGIEFQDASNNVGARFRFTGGASFYAIDDFAGSNDTTVGFTANGINVKLTLNNSSGGYSLNVGGTPFSSRMLMSGVTSIAKIRVFNFSAGSGDAPNLYFNTLQISAVPEISPLLAWPVLAAVAGVGARLFSRRRRTSR